MGWGSIQEWGSNRADMVGGDSLCNLAIGNEYLICVRNIEGHIAPQHTVNTFKMAVFSPFHCLKSKLLMYLMMCTF